MRHPPVRDSTSELTQQAYILKMGLQRRFQVKNVNIFLKSAVRLFLARSPRKEISVLRDFKAVLRCLGVFLLSSSRKVGDETFHQHGAEKTMADLLYSGELFL